MSAERECLIHHYSDVCGLWAKGEGFVVVVDFQLTFSFLVGNGLLFCMTQPSSKFHTQFQKHFWLWSRSWIHKPYTIENCRRPHTCYARDEFSELLNDKRLQLEFSKQSLALMSFLDKNKKRMCSHFWSSHS